MKPVIYTDKDGYMRRSLVRDNDDESDGEFGIPYGPPDIRQLDWESMMKEMNNSLVSAGIFTWRDAQQSSVGVLAATSILKREIIRLYREAEKGE
jgi:hypothetical protein